MKKYFLLLLFVCCSSLASKLLALPIHDAARAGRLAQMRHLIAVKGHIDIIDEHGWVPLHYAAYYGHDGVVQALIGAGAGLSTTTYRGEATALHLAAAGGHLAVVRALLNAPSSKIQIMIRARDSYERTPLHLAVISNHLNTVQFLLSLGANVNTQDHINNTPLHYAAINGHLNMVLSLIAAGASVGASNVLGFSPLYLAAMHGHLHLIPHLATGIDPFALIQVAQSQGHDHVIHALIGSGIAGMPSFYLAVQQGMTNVVQSFIDFGLALNIANPQGLTLLHLAAQSGHAAIFSLLVTAGADISALSSNGETVLELAELHGNIATITAALNPSISQQVESVAISSEDPNQTDSISSAETPRPESAAIPAVVF